MKNGFKQLVILLAVWSCFPVLAHDARPVVVKISEEVEGLYRAGLRVPPTVDFANMPVLRWPQNCVIPETVPQNGASVSARFCPGGLEGRQLQLAYPHFNPSLATYFQFTALNGLSRSAILPPSESGWLVPEQAGKGAVAFDYLVLGMEHIIGGLDHLLFVLGLLLVAKTPKRILLTVTGFTLAHSITLSLSSLGYLFVPIVPVEAAIALSILFLAHEISLRQQDSLTYRFPLLVAFCFGLLHGLGFASALGEVGLADNELVLSLLFFNLGVEVGQVAFIVAVLLLVFAFRMLRNRLFRLDGRSLILSYETVAAYGIGVPSAYWLLERLTQF